MNRFVLSFCCLATVISASVIPHIPSGSVGVTKDGALVAGPAGSIHTNNGLWGHGAGAQLSGPSGDVKTSGGHATLHGPGNGHDDGHWNNDQWDNGNHGDWNEGQWDDESNHGQWDDGSNHGEWNNDHDNDWKKWDNEGNNWEGEHNDWDNGHDWNNDGQDYNDEHDDGSWKGDHTGEWGWNHGW